MTSAGSGRLLLRSCSPGFDRTGLSRRRRALPTDRPRPSPAPGFDPLGRCSGDHCACHWNPRVRGDVETDWTIRTVPSTAYQTEPAGLPRLGVNSGSPGSGVASSRSSGRVPSTPSIDGSRREIVVRGLTGNLGLGLSCLFSPQPIPMPPSAFQAARGKVETSRVCIPVV